MYQHDRAAASTAPNPVVVTGLTLTCPDVVAVARQARPISLHPDGRRRAALAHSMAEHIVGQRSVYGRTTGVGANRVEAVAADDRGHGLRLLRSHASGTGPLESPDRVRAAMVVRLNQLAAGGSGVAPELLDGLEVALVAGAVPAIHRLGSIGTGDLCALAELGLTLCGDLSWRSGGPPPVQLTSTDALALISSNAVTIGEAVLAHHDLSVLLAASEVVTGLSFLALGGAAEAYGAPVQGARAHPGQALVAQRLRDLLALDGGAARPGRRLQDPFSLRAVPQVHGTAVDALSHLGSVLAVEINARAENPLIDLETADAWHNANFHTGYLAHALDGARSAIYPVAELSAARLGDLIDPDFANLPAFLADGPPGSSGVMILEYVAHDGVASLRHSALPAALGTAVVSRGLEDHASFSTHAARLASTAVPALRAVLAAELVAAIRALAMQDGPDASYPIRNAYDLARTSLDPELTDRPLSADLDVAGRLLEAYGAAPTA
ncbi:MAG: aromatic amino acid lyase [Geodermatophilaceae bacterium]|nr:aromatic amino acid lyase [Geodermatophilaceae bacterium]